MRTRDLLPRISSAIPRGRRVRSNLCEVLATNLSILFRQFRVIFDPLPYVRYFALDHLRVRTNARRTLTDEGLHPFPQMVQALPIHLHVEEDSRRRDRCNSPIGFGNDLVSNVIYGQPWLRVRIANVLLILLFKEFTDFIQVAVKGIFVLLVFFATSKKVPS